MFNEQFYQQQLQSQHQQQQQQQQQIQQQHQQQLQAQQQQQLQQQQIQKEASYSQRTTVKTPNVNAGISMDNGSNSTTTVIINK